MLPLLKAVGTAGVCEAKKVLEPHLLTPISALPTSRLLLPRAQVTKHVSVQLSGHTSPALPRLTDASSPLWCKTIAFGKKPQSSSVSALALFQDSEAA